MDFNPFILEIDIISVAVLLIVRFGISEYAIQDRAISAFRRLVDFSILFCILNSTGQCIPTANIPVIKIINCLKIITCICMGCSWFLAVFFTTSVSAYNLRKWFTPIILPSIIVSVIAIVDTFSNISVEPLEMKPLVWVLLNVLTILYIVSASLICLAKARKCTNRFIRQKLYFITFVMALPLLSLILQAKFYEMPITSPSFVVVILFIFYFYKERRITSNSVTGLNNANKLASYLDSITQNQNPAKRLFFVKIEIDNFGAMRKKHGKAAAMEALQKMASFLRRQCINRGSFIAHLNKSAFAIVTECSSLSELETLLNRLIATSATGAELAQGPWSITFSIYWSEFGTPTTKTVDELIDGCANNCYKPKARED